MPTKHDVKCVPASTVVSFIYFYFPVCFLSFRPSGHQALNDLLIHSHIRLLSSRLMGDGVLCVQSIKNVTTSSLPFHYLYFKVISVQ